MEAKTSKYISRTFNNSIMVAMACQDYFVGVCWGGVWGSRFEGTGCEGREEMGVGEGGNGCGEGCLGVYHCWSFGLLTNSILLIIATN